ncbi:acetylornithine deacetylase [Streptomyces cinerochromogenes]|uniref:acetylornithine deacetylase n=1 Tax=Streptomyces cinerochromogenes TaxID=66422 RepID=UPI00166FF11A|nr:acetylornithine deacetylase [Streptomyces cinerochromogenes]GGS91884.1 acetylornithine deacetylase [Streptomyces cinerochromogenes]
MSSAIPVRCSDSELYAHMLGILERLVGFDTTSHKSNLELIDYVRELLVGNGIHSELHWNEARTKANLVATAGPGGGGERGVVWSGHTDVVPVDGQSWSADPFTLRLTEDAAIGRGTADMKGFIACCLAILSQADHARLTTPVTLMLTYEEEIGCVGARSLVEEMRTWRGHVTGCIVGEPTGLDVVVGHKGKQNHRITFTGEPKHAALAPQLPNPIVAAAALAGHAQARNEEFRTEGPRDDRFDIGHSWINIGRIDGGVKPNIVPESCVVELEIRNIPEHGCDGIAADLHGHATGALLDGMRALSDIAEVTVEQLSDTPSFAIEPDHEFVTFVRKAFGTAEEPVYVPFGTEAGLIWEHAGIPTVVCGPGFITEAHTADEFVALDQLRACLDRLKSLPLA